MNKKSLVLLTIMTLSQAVYAKTPINLDKYAEQANQLYSQMTLDQKLGQLLQPTYSLLALSVPQPQGKKPGYLCEQALNQRSTNEEMSKACGLNLITQYHIGSVLQAGGPNYNYPSLQNWQQLNRIANQAHSKNNHDPLLLIGNDAIHGNTHVAGSVVFPQDINLGMTHDPKLVYKIGQAVANDSLISGFNWVFMPTVAVAQDLRWGRSYESFAADPALVKQFSQAYISGFQQSHDGKITGVLATVKHFIGDGATQYGLDEGNAVFHGSEKDFWLENGLGYEGALDAGAVNMMISYNAINQNRMHFGGQWAILDQFKHQGIMGSDNQIYQFKGFTVSDYNGPSRAAYFYNQQHPQQKLANLAQVFALTINSGVDMIMLGSGDTQNPFDLTSAPYFATMGQAFTALKQAYNQKLISDARLQEAVTRILEVKLAMASHEQIQSYDKLQKLERHLALQAAEQSLVLLKDNHQTLPLESKEIKYIVLLGDTNDIGIQNGGWTINWQGQKGNTYFEGQDKISAGASTLEDALHQQFDDKAQIIHADDLNKYASNLDATNTIVITLVAETPYAEYMGDIANPYEQDKWYQKGYKAKENKYMPAVQSQDLSLEWDAKEAKLIKNLHEKNIPVITIVYSGRPVILSKGGEKAPLPNSDVVIAAFLPGTAGGDALVNSLLGKYHFGKNHSNQLSFPWPRDMQDISTHFKQGSLYPVGSGLKT